MLVWWLAMRPRTIWASVAPVIVGTALAWSQTQTLLVLPALFALLGAILIQVATNLHNDVADFERGADTPDRLGPPRATQMGWLSGSQVRRGAFLCFGLAFLCGIYLVWHGGWPIVGIGIASLIAGWAYTGGPRPIAYSPTGEFFVWLFFGLAAVGGSYYLQTFSFDAAAFVAASMMGLFGAGIITVNNTRDIGTDERVGKRTLAVVLGRRRIEAVYALELFAPFALLPLLALVADRGWSLALPLLILPAIVAQVGRFRREPAGPGFNELLARTAKLQLVFCLLLSAGLIL
ncbi:1,4-dihydroxy-2-naphthoate octaprenyltransferase [Rhodocyclus purpureus]|nr:1,4-dihydroxy-2-naphthoate octaprenyltransferase [Rhodocyclus purpureus]